MRTITYTEYNKGQGGFFHMTDIKIAVTKLEYRPYTLCAIAFCPLKALAVAIERLWPVKTRCAGGNVKKACKIDSSNVQHNN